MYTQHDLEDEDRDLLSNVAQMRDYMLRRYKERALPRNAWDKDQAVGESDEFHGWLSSLERLGKRLGAEAAAQYDALRRPPSVTEADIAAHDAAVVKGETP